MAHCPYDQLLDMEEALDKIRKQPLLKEKKPGIFYIKNQSFLHFHIKDDRRWADARDGKQWGPQIDLPFNASKKIVQNFITEVKRKYETQI
jgi:hypothetical protein